MVRRVELRLIEDELSRQLSFAKRRNGLIKKALELFVVCNVDCLFISFSPSGRLSYFSSDKRIEDILARFAALPNNIRRLYLSDLELNELLHILTGLSGETEELFQNDRAVLAVQQEANWLQQELDSVNSTLRRYESSLESDMAIEEANMCEGSLEERIARIQERKMELTGYNDNDASQPSDSANGAENSSGNPSDEVNQAEPENQPGEDSGKNQSDMPNQSPAAESSRLMFMARSPPRSLLLGRTSPHPQHGGSSYSGLLMSADIAEILSPNRDTPAMPFILSPQLPEQNNSSSFQQNQYSVFQDGLRTNQFYPDGYSMVANQSSDGSRSTYGTPNGYNFPVSNWPSNHELPSSPANFQVPHQMQFQLASPNAAAVPVQFPYFDPSSQMPLGGSNNAMPYCTPQWPYQRTLQPNYTPYGQRGGHMELLHTVSGMNNMYPPDAGSPFSPRPSNLHMNHQSVGGPRMPPNLSLNLQGPLANSTELGMQGNQMPYMQGHPDAGGSSSPSYKRKLPWEDDVALRLSNRQNISTASSSVPPIIRPLGNAVYDPAYEEMGYHIDPHFRMLVENRKKASSGNQHQQNQ